LLRLAVAWVGSATINCEAVAQRQTNNASLAGWKRVSTFILFSRNMLPTLIEALGDDARTRFLEFFTRARGICSHPPARSEDPRPAVALHAATVKRERTP
jgi:hypothetical protein